MDAEPLCKVNEKMQRCDLLDWLSSGERERYLISATVLSIYFLVWCRSAEWVCFKLGSLPLLVHFELSSSHPPSYAQHGHHHQQQQHDVSKRLYLRATQAFHLSQCSTEPHDGKSLLFPSPLFLLRGEKRGVGGCEQSLTDEVQLFLSALCSDRLWMELGALWESDPTKPTLVVNGGVRGRDKDHLS